LHGAIYHGILAGGTLGNMKRNRRKAIIRFFERAALGVAILDAAIYFAAVRPLRNRIAATESSYHQERVQTQLRQARVDRLEKLQKNLPTTDDQLKTFLDGHVPPRQHAFSEADRLIRELTTQSAVQLDTVSYKLTSEKGEPLERLGIDVTVEGPFSNLLKFAHSLESAQQLILLRNFTFSASQGRIVSLKVGAELFLTP
jgi:Tfp pilus assembly protein PilO